MEIEMSILLKEKENKDKRAQTNMWSSIKFASKMMFLCMEEFGVIGNPEREHFPSKACPTHSPSSPRLL